MSSIPDRSPRPRGKSLDAHPQGYGLGQSIGIGSSRSTSASSEHEMEERLAMIGAWADGNFRRADPGINQRDTNNHGGTSQCTSSNNSSDNQRALEVPGHLVSGQTAGRPGSDHRCTTAPVPAANPIHGTKERMDPSYDPMQRWYDEKSVEQPWNGIGHDPKKQ